MCGKVKVQVYDMVQFQWLSSSRACVVLEKEEEKERTLQVPPESRISQQQLPEEGRTVTL